MPRLRYGREEKLAAVKRMLAGENVFELSFELQISRKMLYEWRGKYLGGGAAALRGPGQPRKLTRGDPPPDMDAALPLPSHAELAKARKAFEDENDEYYKLGLKYSKDTQLLHPAVIGHDLAAFLYAKDIPQEQTTITRIDSGPGPSALSSRPRGERTAEVALAPKPAPAAGPAG